MSKTGKSARASALVDLLPERRDKRHSTRGRALYLIQFLSLFQVVEIASPVFHLLRPLG